MRPHRKKKNIKRTPQISRHTDTISLQALKKINRKLRLQISHHKREDNALRESEERYRSLVETTHTGYVILDARGKVLDANKEYVRLTGRRSLGQIRGRSVIQWTAAHEKVNNAKAVRKCLSDGHITDFETAYVDRQRRITPILINATVIKVGGSRKILTMCRNLTEIKRAEEGIKRFLSLERATLESTADGILVVDGRTGKVSDFNDRFAQLWNIPRVILESRDDKRLLKHILPQLKDPQGFLSKVVGLYRHPLKKSFDILKFKNGKIFERYSHPQLLDGKPVGRVWSFRDVTERELIERELRESEEKFRSVTEQSPNVIFINQGGKVVYVNRQCEKAMGYKAKEFYAPRFNFISLIYPDDHAVLRHNFQAHQQGKEVAPIEYKMVTKDREILNAILTTKLIDYRGKKAILGIITDITDRKKASELLNRREAYLSSIIENQPGMVWLKDRDSRFLAVNLAFAKMAGRKGPEEVVGRTDLDIWPSELARNYRADDRRVMRRKEHVTVEEFISEKGVLRWHETFKAPVFGADEKVIGTTGYARDVTERKKSEHDLRASETRYRRLFEAAKDGILILNAATGMIEDVNPFLVRMLGYSYATFLGKKLWEVGAFKDTKKCRVAFRELQTKKYIRYEDMPLETKDGRLIQAEFVSNVYRIDGVKVIQCNIRDITDRKKTEEKLALSGQRMALHVKQTPLAVIEWSEDFKVREWNPAAEKIFGYAKKEALGKHWWFIVPRTARAEVGVVGKALIGQTGGQRSTNENITKTGKSIICEWFNTTLVDPNGNTIGVASLVEDITVRKIAEEEVRKTQIRYQQLVENAKDGIFTIDSEGRFLLTNPEFRAMLGYNQKEFKLLNILDTYPEDLQGNGRERMNHLRKGRTLRLERPMKRKDGSVIFVEASAWDTQGGNVQAFVRDITERKQAEEALRESRRQLMQIIDTVPHMIFAKDETGRFLLVNRAVGRAYGMEPRQLVGRKRQDIHPVREEAERSLTVDRQVLDTGKPVVVKDDTFTDGRGEKHVLQTIKIPFRMAGLKEKAILGVSVDVTEQKKVEEFRNEIVRTVSHELRTPLSIEKEGISLLLDGIFGAVSPEQKEILETVMRSIDRLSRMITSLLDISSIETGKIKLSKKRTNLADLAKDVAFEFKKRAHEKNIDLHKKLPEGGTWILADPDKITQALSNLVDNAIKFTPEGGAVEISLAVLKDTVECCIRDTGVGIAPGNISKLFEKFQQFSRTAGPGEKGFGLGLSITKGIIEMHGGRIWATSEFGKGTQITFTLPSCPEERG